MTCSTSAFPSLRPRKAGRTYRRFISQAPESGNGRRPTQPASRLATVANRSAPWGDAYSPGRSSHSRFGKRYCSGSADWYSRNSERTCSICSGEATSTISAADVIPKDSSHQNSTVHLQHLSRDVSGFLGGEELHSVGHVEVAAGASQGYVFHHAFFQLGRKHRRHGGFDPPGRDRVDGNVARCDFAGDCHGQSNEAGLRRCVVRLARLSDLSEYAGDVDNAAPALLEHGSDDGLGKEERRGEIRVQHFVPVGSFHAHHQLVAGDACIVHKDVDFAEAGENRFHSGLDLFFVGDIDLEGCCLAALRSDFGGELIELLLIARTQCQLRSRGGEHQSASAANTLRRSGNECYAAFHTRHDGLS